MFVLALAIGLQAQLDALLKTPDLKGALVGVYVMDSQGKTVYEHGADMRLVPASNQKILSAAMALETLGPEFTWKTRFWKEDGRCVVDAEGDPTLVAADLAKVAKELKLPPGTPVVVRATFGQDYPEGWETDDLPNRYSARPAGFCYDRAGFEIFAEKGKLVPLAEPLGVLVRYRKGSGSPQVRLDLCRRQATVVGTLPDKRTSLDTLAQPDPIGSACAMIGGVYAGRTDNVPDRAPDVTLESKPLGQVLPSCLKPSDNHIAEHLMLSATGHMWATNPGPRNGQFGYGPADELAATFFAGYAGATSDDLHMVDGSGLSRHNLVTPRFLARVLQQVRSKKYAKVFLDALPKAGEGTLSNRLKGQPVAAKTGSLDGVISLSGYLGTDSDEPWTFSIVCNHTVASPAKVRAAQDKIVTALLLARTKK
ncbi:MAG: D-alanyl-D-alanine carboxypeptidase [Fimbriimonadaceae bacterium]|nr:D-alanyl-D-alanine carboxypeptidase [Fimbriimonadaceae bacterium]